MRRLFWLMLAVPFLFQIPLRGQDAAKFTERLHAVDAATALDGADAKPWHLKVSVQLFDRKGQTSDEGTIEEWWNSPELDRREYKTKGYTATEIRSGGKLYRTQGVDLPPYYLELLREQVVHPIVLREETAPELRKLHLGTLDLDCIELRPAAAKGPSTLGAFPAYCVDVGGTSLRVTLGYSIQEVIRSLIGKFQGKQVAVDAVVSAYGSKAAAEHIDGLSGGAAPESEFAVTAETPEVVPPIVSSSDRDKVVAGERIFMADPLFPVMAKAQHVAGGTVVVRAIVRTNGSVRSVAAISSSNPVFEGAAMDAVKQWKFTPYTRDGQPVEMEIVAVLNFSS